MTAPSLPEVWLRGPIDGVPTPLQPVAHALLQAGEEVGRLMAGFPDDRLWERPGGVASPGFHLQHMTGVIDRLFTYARGDRLRPAQLALLGAEGNPPADGGSEGRLADALTEALRDRIETAISELRTIAPETLADPRPVGRQGLPSSVQGLLFHAAEHVQRHLGQLLVTVRILRDGGEVAGGR